jgi:negative regulator of sigma E activity
MLAGKHIVGVALVGVLIAVAQAAQRAPAGPAHSSDEAVGLLRAMVAAEPGLLYEGVRQTGGGERERSRSVRIYHDGARRSRIELLNDDGEVRRIIVRDGSRVWIRLVGEEDAHDGWHRQPDRAGSERYQPWQSLDLILKNYRVRRDSDETFLGRPTAVLSISSERPNRPHVRLWVDLATKLNVKLERTAPGGERVFGFEFVQLSFPRSFDDALFEVPSSPEPTPGPEGRRGARDSREAGDSGRWRRIERFDSLGELSTAMKVPLWVPGKVPAGFERTEYSLVLPMGVARIGYSDGLSEISLYERVHRGRPRTAEGRRRERPPAGSGAPAGDQGPERPGPSRRREGDRRAERGRRRRPRIESLSEVTVEGVKLQVGHMGNMVFVRRTVTAGDPPMDVEMTVVGEIDAGELERMGASLVEYRPGRAEGVAGHPKEEASDVH